MEDNPKAVIGISPAASTLAAYVQELEGRIAALEADLADARSGWEDSVGAARELEDRIAELEASAKDFAIDVHEQGVLSAKDFAIDVHEQDVLSARVEAALRRRIEEIEREDAELRAVNGGEVAICRWVGTGPFGCWEPIDQEE